MSCDTMSLQWRRIKITFFSGYDAVKFDTEVRSKFCNTSTKTTLSEKAVEMKLNFTR